jgi:hypothetical protein
MCHYSAFARVSFRVGCARPQAALALAQHRENLPRLAVGGAVKKTESSKGVLRIWHARGLASCAAAHLHIASQSAALQSRTSDRTISSPSATELMFTSLLITHWRQHCGGLTGDGAAHLLLFGDAEAILAEHQLLTRVQPRKAKLAVVVRLARRLVHVAAARAHARLGALGVVLGCGDEVVGDGVPVGVWQAAIVGQVLVEAAICRASAICERLERLQGFQTCLRNKVQGPNPAA